MITVQHLFIYPVKSFAGIAVDQFEFDQFGPENDRRYMLIDENLNMLSQRRYPLLAIFKPILLKQQMSISFNEHHIDFSLLESNGQIINAKVWSDQVLTEEVSSNISHWFSERLNKPVKLVKISEKYFREMDKSCVNHSAQVGFADGFQMLLTTEPSLQALNLGENEDMLRFRPNIVLKGCDAYAEDSWSNISINNVQFNIVKACSRCLMPAVNPSDGSKQPEVIRKLAQKRLFNKETFFGQNIVLDETTNLKTAIISVGNQVMLQQINTQPNLH